MGRIKLRAHHRLCISFFEGKGYDDNFTGNMRAVITALDRNPEIIIVACEDMICKACPNNKNGICDCIKMVDGYDKAVMRLCNINSGDILSWAAYKTLVSKNILETGKISAICGDCQWSDICLKKQIGYRNSTDISPKRSTSVSPLLFITTRQPASSIAVAFALQTTPFL